MEDTEMGFIDYEVEGAVGIITINRPKALNALNEEVLNDLEAAFDAVDLNTVRCLILTGAGAFIANILMYVWIGAPSTILLILVGITFAIGMPFQSMSNMISGPVFGDQAYLANPKLMAFSNAGYSLFFPVLGAIATGAGFGPAYLANAVICLLTVIPFLIGLSIAEKRKRG
jgi:hypothetical protein